MPALEIAVAEAMYLNDQRTSTDCLWLSDCARAEMVQLQAQLSQLLIELLPSDFDIE
jgi:hypothetical protein